MSKFIDIYPNMTPIVDENNGIIKGNKNKPCYICKELTEYVEINYETYFCSEECVKVMDKFCEEN